MTESLHPAQRWRTLIAVIASISVVGLSLGLSVPLVSLTLERQNIDSGLIGLMAAMPAVGILCFSPLIPRFVIRLGARTTMYGAIIVAGSTVLLLPLLEHYGIWLLLRFVMGAADAVLFIVSETWINQIAEDRNRGRLVALYATVLSLCMAGGPLLIPLTGSTGVLPFAVACVILCVGAIPLLWAGDHTPPLEENPEFSVFSFVHIAPALCGAVMLFAFIDACGLSLLPLFGLRHGYDEAAAAAMVTALIGGNVALQIPLGWLADHMNRNVLQIACTCVVFFSALALPLAAPYPALLWPSIVILGAAAGGVYTLALIIVGERFSGAALVTANAAFGVLWGVGNLAGPLAAGLGMRVLNPDGLPLTLALVTAVFLGLLGWRHLRTVVAARS